MQNSLYLEKFADKSEIEIKVHLALYYGNTRHYENELDSEVIKKLNFLNILIAYEYDLDSYDEVSWFLFKDKNTGKLYELYANHCSCNGFENQFNLEETSLEFLMERGKYNDDKYTCEINEFIINHLI